MCTSYINHFAERALGLASSSLHRQLPTTFATMDGLIFVNSANIDFKRLNRLFVYLNDWDYGDDNDFFKLVTTKDAHELDENEGTRLMSIEPVHADLDADPANAWQGSSLADIEKHILGLGGTLYLLLDDKGALDHTVIIGERRWDDETEGLTDDFDRVRCPWDCAYSMWANLDIVSEMHSLVGR